MILRRSKLGQRLKQYVTSVQSKVGDVVLSADDVNAEGKYKSNLDSTRDPLPTDDATKGYVALSKWVNKTSGNMFSCIDNSSGQAVWRNGSLDISDLGSAALMTVGDQDSEIPTCAIVRSMIPAQQTKQTLGLEFVNNTPDSEKPVSTAQQHAIDEAVQILSQTFNSKIDDAKKNVSYNDLSDRPILFTGNYADLAGLPTLFDGTWDSLKQKPTLFSGNYADLSGKPNLFSGSFNDLSDKPNFFDGNYSSLSGKPNLFSGSYNDLSDKPILFDGKFSSLTGVPGLFSGNYKDLSNKPILFDGKYTSLSDRPALFSGNYSDLAGKPNLFSGSYTDLSNKPAIPSTTSDISEGTRLYYTDARVRNYLSSKGIRDSRYYDVVTDANGHWQLDVSALFSTIDFVDAYAYSPAAGALPLIAEQRMAHIVSATSSTGIVKGTVTRSNLITTILIGGAQGWIFAPANSPVRVKIEGVLK